MGANVRLHAVATVLAVCAFPLVAQAYPSEIVDFTINGFGSEGSGSGEIIFDVANGNVLEFNMSISGLTANSGFLTDTVSFNDPALLSDVDHGTPATTGGEWISFSYDTSDTSGNYATLNFHNRFYINEGPSDQALFFTSVTSDVIDSPEPASFALLGAGAGALAMARRRRRV